MEFCTDFLADHGPDYAEDPETGVVTLTTNGKGDFANYFREATITLTEPKNYSTEGVVLGKYTVEEINMFQAEVIDDDSVIFTYYLLSNANRAFSADDEELGESVIAFRLTNDGKLEMQFRDYDMPPFGEMWWDDDFDADMFAFCSVFTKEQ